MTLATTYNSGQISPIAGQKAIAWQQQIVTNNTQLPVPHLVFLSGYRSDMNGTKAQFLSQHCAARGYNLTRFDYRGHGQTGGHYADYTLSDWLADSLSVIDTLTAGRLILVGSSMGGWLMLRVAQERRARIAALVGIAPAPDFVSELIEPHLTATNKAQLAAEGRFIEQTPHSAEGNIFTQAFLTDSAQHRIFAKPYPFTGAVRILQGSADQDVPPFIAQKLFDHMDAKDLRLTLFKGGDHRLSEPHHLAALGAQIDDVVAAL